MTLRGPIVLCALLLWPAHGLGQQLRQAQSEAEMDQVVARFLEERRAAVQGWIDTLHAAQAPAVQARACFLLGELRDPAAVRALLAHLLVAADVPDESRRLPLWGQYPCQEALAKIGKPAESALLEELSEWAGGEREAAALSVLQRIEGGRGAVFVLEQAWERAGPAERKGLDAALARARKETP